MNHEVKFFTNERTGLAAAQCSCGQYWSGTLEAVQACAAAHDLDEKPQGGKPNGKVKDIE